MLRTAQNFPHMEQVSSCSGFRSSRILFAVSGSIAVSYTHLSHVEPSAFVEARPLLSGDHKQRAACPDLVSDIKLHSPFYHQIRFHPGKAKPLYLFFLHKAAGILPHDADLLLLIQAVPIPLDSPVSYDLHRIRPVSYTHLDVYKRQSFP